MSARAWNGRPGRSAKFISRSTRMAIYLRDGFDCVFRFRCGGVFPLGRELTLDHVVPRSEGGPDRPGNLVTSCFLCNSLRQHAPLRARERRIAEAQTAKPLDRAAARALTKDKRWDPESAAGLLF